MKMLEPMKIDETFRRSLLKTLVTRGIGRTRTWIRYLVLVAAFNAAVNLTLHANAGDLIRYLSPDSVGSLEERFAEGSIKAEDVDVDGVGIYCDSDAAAPDENPIPTEMILWIQYENEPLTLAAVRVEIEVGNYEEALEKLADVNEDDVRKNSLIETEYEWYKAFATLKLALTDVENADVVKSGSAMLKFIKDYSTSYHYYDACQLMADAYYKRSLTSQSDEKRAQLKSAKGAYGELLKANSLVIQARGNLGLARIALESGELDEARKLFEKTANNREFIVEYSEATIGLARVIARQGRIDDALETMNALLKETPNDATLRQARIYNALGDLYNEANRYQEAAVAYLHVDLLYPTARTERVYALKALVETWKKLNREDRATETIQRLKNRFNVIIE